MKSQMIKALLGAAVVAGVLTNGMYAAAEDDVAAKARAKELFTSMEAVATQRALELQTFKARKEFFAAVEGDSSSEQVMNAVMGAAWMGQIVALDRVLHAESPAVQQELYRKLLRMTCGYGIGSFVRTTQRAADGTSKTVVTYSKEPGCFAMEAKDMRKTSAGFACYVRAAGSCIPTFDTVKTENSSSEHGLCMMTAFEKCAEEFRQQQRENERQA